MARHTRCFALVALLASIGAGVTSSAGAQQVASPARKQVISANPFGLLLEFFNAEYERVVSTSSTAGVGGSTLISDNDRYVNVDAFWRYYPQKVPNPLDGWAFGIKAGVTTVSQKTYVGAGFDVNRSWLLGQNDNFYVGLGFGLKRIIGHDTGLQFVPTFRIVNVGFAF